VVVLPQDLALRFLLVASLSVMPRLIEDLYLDVHFVDVTVFHLSGLAWSNVSALM